MIPAYNAEATLPSVLESVLRQTFKSFEVLVIDDGSADRTGDIARSVGDPVRCIAQTNQGVSMARNTGIKAARGRYIALLDADDIWHEEKLSKQIASLKVNPDAVGSYVGVTKVWERGDFINDLPARGFDDLCRSLLLHSSVIPGSSSTLLLRREVFDLVGPYDPKLSQCADWDLLIRVSLKGRLEPVGEPLVRYRSSTSNMSRNIPLLEKDTFAVLDKFYSSPESAPYLDIKDRVYSNHWLILSGSYLHDRQLRKSSRCLARALRRDPTNVVYPLALPLRLLKRARQKSG